MLVPNLNGHAPAKRILYMKWVALSPARGDECGVALDVGITSPLEIRKQWIRTTNVCMGLLAGMGGGGGACRGKAPGCHKT